MRLFNRPNRVDASRAAELLERREVVVLDVRENVEWKAGRIPGALHVPLAQVPFRGRELPRNTTIVTVCRSGHRSGLAAPLVATRRLPGRGPRRRHEGLGPRASATRPD